MSQIIEVLKSARARKAMYLETVDVVRANAFLDGFKIGVFACGPHKSNDLAIRERVLVARGWAWWAGRPSDEMRERGLTEEQIVDELFAIEIAYWEAYLADKDDTARTS